MTEVTIEVLTVDDHGRHGVAYRTVDTDNVPAIVAAHALLGVPYTFAHAGSRRRGDTVAHRSVRHPNRALHPFRAARAARLTPTGSLRLVPPPPRRRGPCRGRSGHDGAARGRAHHARGDPRAAPRADRVLAAQHPPLTIRSARVEQLSGDLRRPSGCPGCSTGTRLGARRGRDDRPLRVGGVVGDRPRPRPVRHRAGGRVRDRARRLRAGRKRIALDVVRVPATRRTRTQSDRAALRDHGVDQAARYLAIPCSGRGCSRPWRSSSEPRRRRPRCCSAASTP